MDSLLLYRISLAMSQIPYFHLYTTLQYVPMVWWTNLSKGIAVPNRRSHLLGGYHRHFLFFFFKGGLQTHGKESIDDILSHTNQIRHLCYVTNVASSRV